jgi:hypothetical protein
MAGTSWLGVTFIEDQGHQGVSLGSVCVKLSLRSGLGSARTTPRDLPISQASHYPTWRTFVHKEIFEVRSCR